MKPRNARFWTWENDGWVKLTLRPGQSLAWGQSHATDEGYSFHGNTWSYDLNGIVTNEWESGGRDCDGELVHSGECYAHVNSFPKATAPELVSNDETNSPGQPDWIRGKTTVYDQYAQLAGY